MNRKQKITLSITGIILVTLILVGLTYGYYLTTIKGNTNTKSITTSLANLELKYDDGNGIITSSNLEPGDSVTKTFSVENTGNKKVVNYVVYLEDVINTFEDKNDLKLTLDCTSSINSNCMGNNTIYPDKDTLLVLNDIEVGEIQTYELKVDFIETHDDQSDNMNKIIEGNIVIKNLKETENSLETVSGTDNVMLDNPKLIKNFRIYGNSIQDGTPTPDTPVEIQSVGERTKNLFNKNSFTSNLWVGIESGSAIYETNYKGTIIKVKPNTNYIISGNTNGGNDGTLRIFQTELYPSVGVITTAKRVDFDNINFGVNGRKIKTASNTNYLLISAGILKDASLFEIQLEEGTTATEYEPYGYKIPVKVSGKNFAKPLFETNFVTDYIPVKKDETYIYSESGVGTPVFVYFYETVGGTGTYTYIDKDQTWTATKDGYIRINKSTSSKFEIMLEKNTVITQYEQYVEPITTNIFLNEPLRKIGNYADYIDFANKKVVRQIKEVVLDGVTTNKKIEQFNLYPSNNLYYAVVTGTNSVNGYADVLLNTHFIPASGVEKGHCYITARGKFHVMVHTNQELNSIALWNAWLQEQYNNGTPVIFDYALAEEIPEDIVLPTISTNEGTNIIEVDTTISPSRIDIEYLK